MKPNLEKMIEILGQKLAQAEMQSAQWQSIADDAHVEIESLKSELEQARESKA